MAHGLALFGLALALWGSWLLVWDDFAPWAARIRQRHESDPPLKGGPFAQAVFRAARRFGSSHPPDQQSYVAESLPRRALAFVLLVLGFTFQAAGVAVDLLRGWGRS